MVCVPCIFIPVLLWIYHKFLQPIVEPIMRKWMGKPAAKKKVEVKEKAAECPIKTAADPVEEKQAAEKADADDDDDDDVATGVRQRVTRSRSRKAE